MPLSIKYQLAIARLPLGKDLAPFTFTDTPVNRFPIRQQGDRFAPLQVADDRAAALVAAPGCSATVNLTSQRHEAMHPMVERAA